MMTQQLLWGKATMAQLWQRKGRKADNTMAKESAFEEAK